MIDCLRTRRLKILSAVIGCLRTRVHKQPIIALYFESDTVLKFYVNKGVKNRVNGTVCRKDCKNFSSRTFIV